MSSLALREFHDFYGWDDPSMGFDLRIELIREEYQELLAELKEYEPDKRKIYKELADLLYVLYGLDVHLGSYLDETFEAVHQANMSKLWQCEECWGKGHVWDGESFSEDAGGRLYNQCGGCGGDGKVAVRRADGKILKPPTYQPPDLSFIPYD